MQKRFYTARALLPLRHCLSLSDVRALNLMCGKNHASTKIAPWQIFNKLKNREEKNLTHTLLLLDTQQQQQPIHFILLLFFIALARNISIFQYNFRTFKEQSCQICLSSCYINAQPFAHKIVSCIEITRTKLRRANKKETKNK